MTPTLGWYVRVLTREIHDGVYDTVLYVVGLPIAAQAEAAVRSLRSTPGETCEILPDAVTAGRGPQPALGQVWLLKGAA